MGGMGNMMNQFKQAQEIAKKTQAMQAELDKLLIDGTAADGKVVVTLTGNQKPSKVSLDDAYLAGASGEQVGMDVAEAMKEAHQKSMSQQMEKMAELYQELGMGAPPPSP